MNHSGNITGTETWALADSPHVITAHLYIKNGGSVTIEAGCEIQVAQNCGIYVGNEGTGKLVAIGTSVNHITFKRKDAGNWTHIYVYNQALAEQTAFRYCDFEYCGGAGWGYGIKFAGGHPPLYFEHLTFSNMAEYRFLQITGWSADFTVKDITVDNACIGFAELSSCTGAITFENVTLNFKSGSYSMIRVSNSTGITTFKNCIMKNGSASGMYSQVGIEFTNCIVNMQNCLIYDTAIEEGFIVYQTGASGTIINCTFDTVTHSIRNNNGTSGDVHVRNCIFSNCPGTALRNGTSTPKLYSDYNCFYNNDTNYAGTISEKTGDLLATDPLYYLRAGKDFHLKSKAGNYTNAGSWVDSLVNSPCIDAGGAGDPFALEPDYNGERVNMGAYGNTEYASKTEITCWYVYLNETITLSDIDFNNINHERVRQPETITLSDVVLTNVSLEKVNLDDTVTLSDSIFLWNEGFWINLDDSITLADTLNQNLTRESERFNEGAMTLSDVAILNAYKLIDLENDFRTAKATTQNIDNRFSFCKQILSNFANLIHTVSGNLADFTNKINSKRQEFYNIRNDIRTLLSFQIPGDAGVQSLGKSYIKVFINSIEQTDVDVDSINITKSLDSSHSATFELGRAYDSTKPTLELPVEIKYHIWTLYKGYISQIVPANNPESIKIQCQDEYWKKNQEKVYFNIGHKPSSDNDLYYNTIAEGISACGVSFGIGNFIPQTIGLFGSPKSDAISTLINEVGNFSWYYNPGGIARLWQAGEGDIINIERQEIGKNIGLYQVLSHQIKEDAEDIVNKFRVQMGQQVIKRFSSTGGSQTYKSYETMNFPFNPTPNWDASLEVLAKDSATGFGWDYHPTSQDVLYEKVFKEYKLSNYVGGIGTVLEGWSDEFAPKVEINNTGNYMGWECNVTPGRLQKGFTIDYENNLLLFSEPVFCTSKNSYGEVVAIRRPQVYVCLYKKKYYTNTSNPSDNPATDITNPLMFFTSVMGTYPITIMNNLNLSNLSIQVGGWSQETDNTWRLVPSWNDTAFATDYSNWQLSKTCDVKYSGNIEITLDAFCYYGIELNKRIMINNVLDNALNIDSITLNVSSFTASISLKSGRYFARTVSVQSRGE